MNIKEKYINIFFSDLTEEEKKKIHFDQYMWHVFSYEKVLAKEGKEAIEELNKILKNTVYVFFEHNDIIIERDNITYEEIFDNIKNKNIWDYDCYIVDKDFKWTFVFTHESYVNGIVSISEEEYFDGKIFYIGPFFYKIKQ